MGARALALLVPVLVAGCGDAFAGDIIVHRAALVAEGDDHRLEVEVANRGNSAAWVHAAPHRVRLDPDDPATLLVGLHGDEPGEHLVAAVDLLISYQRVVSPSHPVASPRETLVIALPSSLTVPAPDGSGGEVRYEVALADVEHVFVEVAWHDDDPGYVPWSDPPAPDGIAIGEWSRHD
jgi:hypothetical protein